ncbi:MAG: LysM peptidoglycan-binding domain-containing protein, partial [Muribaculaceae bacterium]|nr:LysM peptidoglycan-binding domain-containing protein [Muribaculaceae bacterium]
DEPVEAAPVGTDTVGDSVSVQEPELLPADTVQAASKASAVAAAFSQQTEPTEVEEEEPAPKETAAPTPKPKPTKEAAKPAAKPKTTAHTVRKGENLSKIAKRYGVTVQAIKKANNFAGDQIKVGQKIKIPAK